LSVIADVKVCHDNVAHFTLIGYCFTPDKHISLVFSSSFKFLELSSGFSFIIFKKSSIIKIKKQNYNIKIFENLLDESENFALIKGNIKKNKNPRVRVISSNIVKNYLMGEKLPNSFNQTINYFKKYKEITAYLLSTVTIVKSSF